MGDKKQNKAENKNATSNRNLLAKADSIVKGITESAALSRIKETETAYESQGAVVPNYDPESLLNYIELSPHIKPNIDAYAQNIEGYGYQWVYAAPWMEDIDSSEATDAIREALIIERWQDEEDAELERITNKRDLSHCEEMLRLMKKSRGKHRENASDVAEIEKRLTELKTIIKKQDEDTEPSDDEVQEPEANPEDQTEEQPEEPDNMGVTDADVEAKRKEIKMQIRREMFIFDAWFKNCCSEMSFTQLRKSVRSDIESHGWGGWERKRDEYGRLKRLVYLPGYTLRPLMDDGVQIDVVEDDSITPLSEDREITNTRRMRVYVQIIGERKVYFKSPKDPRVISRTTGKAFDSLAEMRLKKNEGKDAQPANEINYIPLSNPRTLCPPPRWIGNLLTVLGVREADETTYFYLKNNAIPNGLLLIAGGHIPKDLRERIEGKIESNIMGAKGAGKIMVIEARLQKTNSERSMTPSIHYQSMRDSQQDDATFTKYDERGADRCGASFRISPILRGYTPSNLNRATAFAAILFGEQQVFSPERDVMDWIVNQTIIPEIGIKYLRFQSKSPPTRSIEDIERLIKATAPFGGVLTNEIRQLLSSTLNIPLAKIDEAWAKVPMAMTLAGIVGNSSSEQDSDIEDEDEDKNESQEILKRIRFMEEQIAQIVTSELRVSGYDEASASVHIIDDAG